MTRLLTLNDRPGQHAPSWYAATATDIPEPAPLDGETRCDVAIVGAGYTGLSAALHLAEAGADVLVLEAHRIGWGASGRNGGQLGTGQRVVQPALEQRYGIEMARRLWDSAQAAGQLVRRLIARHDIACDLTEGSLHVDHKPGYLADSHRLVEHMARHYGYQEMQALDRNALSARLTSPAYHGGLLDRGGGHLHALNYALGLARAARQAGARIAEATRVTGWQAGDGLRIETDRGLVTADWLILAGNGYLGRLGRTTAAHIFPINNFIIATQKLGAARAAALIPGNEAVSDSRFVVNYFRRTPDHRLIFGGGETYGDRFPRDFASRVRKRMIGVFPQLAEAEIAYAWGGTLAITASRLPLYARAAGGKVITLGGYSGHGIALATQAGQLAAALIRGEEAGFMLHERLRPMALPGGAVMRRPLAMLAMLWYALRDEL